MNRSASNADEKSLFQRILEGCAAFFLGGIVILLAVQIIARHFMGGSVPWSGEMATWFFSWTIFAGTVLVYMEKKHIVIDFLSSHLPPKLLLLLEWIQQLLMLSVLIVLLVTGIQMTGLNIHQTAVSINISKAFLFVSLPIACGLMIIWTIYSWFRKR